MKLHWYFYMFSSDVCKVDRYVILVIVEMIDSSESRLGCKDHIFLLIWLFPTVISGKQERKSKVS